MFMVAVAVAMVVIAIKTKVKREDLLFNVCSRPQ
jgi:hypothetical protein